MTRDEAYQAGVKLAQSLLPLYGGAALGGGLLGSGIGALVGGLSDKSTAGKGAIRGALAGAGAGLGIYGLPHLLRPKLTGDFYRATLRGMESGASQEAIVSELMAKHGPEAVEALMRGAFPNMALGAGLGGLGGYTAGKALTDD